MRKPFILILALIIFFGDIVLTVCLIDGSRASEDIAVSDPSFEPANSDPTAGQTAEESLPAETPSESPELPSNSGAVVSPEIITVSESSYGPMNDFLARFKEVLIESPIDGLIPAAEIPAEDLSWVLKDVEGVTLNDVKGLRFANGDILIVFFFEGSGNVFQSVMTGFPQSLGSQQGKGSQFYIDKGIGIITVSYDYVTLEEMAEKALNIPPDED